MISVGIHTTNPPPRGTVVSLTLCKELKTSALSPVMVFSRAIFFQNRNLFRSLIKIRDRKKVNAAEIADRSNILIILKVNSVIDII